MGMPFPVSKVGSDSQKVEFFTISGRPKTRFSDQISAEFRNFPKFPLATNHAVNCYFPRSDDLRVPAAVRMCHAAGRHSPGLWQCPENSPSFGAYTTQVPVDCFLLGGW